LTDITATLPPFQPDDRLAQPWNDGLAPDPELSAAEWADAFRILSSRGAAETGPYRVARTPYLQEIFDCLSVSSPVQRVVWKKAAQIGASEAGITWIGYIMDQVPGPVMLVQPTVDTAARFSHQRIQPMIDDCPQLAAKVAPTRSRNATNTMLMKEFRGGVLVITGANSAVGLRSMPVRYLMLDEIDAYPSDLEGEGDPVALAEARTRTFNYRSKTFVLSTPKLKGSSRISRAFAQSDKRFYFVPCPYCRHYQVLAFPQLRWEPGKPETVRYHCEACQGQIGEAHKTAMLAEGEWRATADARDPTVRGYHLSALYSPVGWFSWLQVARQWEDAVDDADKRKTFINTVLGEEWEEEADAVPDWQRLYERREAWHHATVPERGLFLTAGADVQADRIEVDVWAWGRQLESWLVEHIVISGRTTEQTTWNGLTELLGRTWEHATGRRLSLQRLAVDTGAFTSEVYSWLRNQDRGSVLGVKGVPAYDRLVPVSGPTRIEVMPNGERLRRGINLWTVSVSYFKKELYRYLKLDKPTDEQLAQGLRFPAGYVHLPLSASDEWAQQLVSEQQVIVRNRHGFATRTEWRQLRARNEAMDCRVYARAAVWLAGADRWSEAKWRDLETQLGLAEPTTARIDTPVVTVRELITEQPLSLAAEPAELGGQIRRVIRRRTRVRY
jgi:phage terminase large subunit GpA-like protein